MQWHYSEKDDNYPYDDWTSCCVRVRKFHETCTETFRVIDNDWASCCVPDTCIVQALEEVHSRLRDARSRTSSAQKVIGILNAKVSKLHHEVEDR